MGDSPPTVKWETRPDAKAPKGVGVLIDTQYLASANEERQKNPYYLIVNGTRYYGASPEAAVDAARLAVKGSLRDESAFVPRKSVSSSLPSGRSMREGTRKAASAVAQGVKGAWQKTTAGVGKMFTPKRQNGYTELKEGTPGPTPSSGQPKATGPTFRNRAASSFKSAGTTISSAGKRVGSSLSSAASTVGSYFKKGTGKPTQTSSGTSTTRVGQGPRNGQSLGLLSEEGKQAGMQGGRRRRMRNSPRYKTRRAPRRSTARA